MKIRPVLTQQSAISVALALGSTLLPGCDQKLGGDVPMTPEMQKKWQSEEQKQERSNLNPQIPSQAVPGVIVIPRGHATEEMLLGELPQIDDEDIPEETLDSSSD